MNKEETLALYEQGSDAWNAWAEKMLADRTALEAAGAWKNASKAYFEEHSFDTEADFRGFNFPGDAGFGGATFRGTAWFGLSVFNCSADFTNAVFQGRRRRGRNQGWRCAPTDRGPHILRDARERARQEEGGINRRNC